MSPREKKVFYDRIFTCVVLVCIIGAGWAGVYGFKKLFAKAEEQVDADSEAMVHTRLSNEQMRRNWINQTNSESYQKAKARGDKYYIHVSEKN